jgi:hypothetical protein
MSTLWEIQNLVLETGCIMIQEVFPNFPHGINAARMENFGNRQWCSGSDLPIPIDLVNEFTRLGSCTDCGQRVPANFRNGSWFLVWHLDRLESKPIIEVLPSCTVTELESTLPEPGMSQETSQ